ncbi:hypothetical protein [Bacillus sp. 1P06AnD]|uniref:hypothetical protein n=1 Tax=Bacillus sp. 1P06AnD TaxID=3132208 RepID=UPI0039A1BFE9
MPIALIKKIMELTVFGVIGYFSFSNVYKNKNAPFMAKVLVGIVNVAPLYVIYGWIKLYIESGVQP